MYSGLKYLFQNTISNRSYYNELSGGFPHSEIPGSKLILNSPGLIAEYHVLHRLLLPRHPPNALLALDLIQKKTDLLSLPSYPCGLTGPKAYFPAQSCDWTLLTIPCGIAAWLVYLTWTTQPFQRADPEDPEERINKARPEGHPKRSPPTCGNQQRCYLYLSKRCQFASDWTGKHSRSACRSNRKGCSRDLRCAKALAPHFLRK